MTDGTVVSRWAALSFADQPQTSRRISTAPCFGESLSVASSIASFETIASSGSASLERAALRSSSDASSRCGRFASASRQAFVAIRYSQARNVDLPLKPRRFRHARRNVYWVRSSESSREPRMR